MVILLIVTLVLAVLGDHWLRKAWDLHIHERGDSEDNLRQH